jgi:hypothetical protein
VKRQKRLTKREQKALRGPRPGAPGAQGHDHEHHIHCTACGKHLDEHEFDGAMATATYLRCRHGGNFPSCVACTDKTRELLEIHDRTGQPVQQAAAWH